GRGDFLPDRKAVLSRRASKRLPAQGILSGTGATTTARTLRVPSIRASHCDDRRRANAAAIGRIVMKYVWFAMFALVASGPAHTACNAKPVKVEAAGNTLGVFDASGKFQSELPKSALTPTAAVLDCNEDLGLIQVDFGNGDTKWLDRGDLKLTFAQGNTPKPV